MTDRISKLGFLAGATRFRRISERLHLDGDKIYKDHRVDFKASWFSTFYTLAKNDRPHTVLDLAEEIGYSHITVKNVIRELEANGLVKIKEHPTDKRSKQITLSAKGLALLKKLEKIWVPFAATLKHLLDNGHPDFLNIISRIEAELLKHPINEKLKVLDDLPQVQILDYKPSLKKYFYELAGPWLLEVLNGALEDEDKFTLNNPDQSYLLQGGFVFYALLNNKVVGCVALKRLDENTFEFAKLFIQKGTRNLGIATKLIERCISRCKENAAIQLWLQTTMRMPEAHKLYYKLGFDDKKAPKQMTVLKRTEKIMVLDLI
jgi:DNA-binding MarR family transcriptional regulator/N-acetylglutamate synthase-like GNAT family acetyltransferase